MSTPNIKFESLINETTPGAVTQLLIQVTLEEGNYYFFNNSDTRIKFAGLSPYEKTADTISIINNAKTLEIKTTITAPGREQTINYTLNISGGYATYNGVSYDEEKLNISQVFTLNVKKDIEIVESESLRPSSRGPHLVLACSIANEPHYFTFDTQDTPSATKSIQAATQPIYNGQSMIDHIYRNPSNYSCGGTIGIYAGEENNNDYKVPGVVEDGGSKLKNFENLMTYIMNEGILCTLTILGGNNTSGDSQFAIYENMLLKECRFTYLITSLKFTLSFTEVIQVAIQEAAQTSLIDEGYPDFYTPDPVSLNQYIIDSSDDAGGTILMLVMRALIESGYLSERGAVTLGRVIAKDAQIIGKQILATWIITAAVTLGLLAATALSAFSVSTVVTLVAAKTAATAAGTAAASTATVAAGTATATGASGTAAAAGVANAWNPVGWVILAVLAILAIIAIIILVRKISQVRWKLFKNLESITVKSNGTYYLKNSANIQPNNSDFEELDNLGKTVLSRFSAASSNMVLYRLCESDESIRSVIVSISGQYIQIDINSTIYEKRGYNKNIRRSDIIEYKKYSFKSSLYGDTTSPYFTFNNNYTIIYDLKDGGYDNYLFKYNSDNDVFYAYIAQVGGSTYINEAGFTFEQSQEAKNNHLSDYYLVIVKGSAKDACEQIFTTIQDILKDEGYTV